nr:DUF3857 domain-containing protein [uncultured Desulfobacter sp.]
MNVLMFKSFAKFHFPLFAIITGFFVVISQAEGFEKRETLSPEFIALKREFDSQKREAVSGAVILFKENQTTIGNGGMMNSTAHIVGKLYSQDAIEQYSQISVPFNSFYDEIDLNFAHTISPEGKILSISKDAFQLKNAQEDYDVKSYSNQMLLTFTLPALEIGSYFEYEVSIKKKPVLNTEWFYDHKFHNIGYNPSNETVRIDPVYISKFNLIIPRTSKIFFSSENADNAVPAIKSEGETVVYSWIQKDLPQLFFEENMPSVYELLPAIKMSSIGKWATIDSWAHELFFQKTILSQDIKEKTIELTRNIENKQDKIMKIAEFINTEIEYVSARRNRDIYYPHTSVETFTNQYGNCQDQVVLLLSMLKAINIKGFPVLISPFPYKRTNTAIPSIDFAHVIAYVPLKTKSFWIDTSSDSFDFPYLHWANQNRTGFIINGEDGAFITTPSSAPGDNKNTVTQDYKFNDRDLLLELTLSIEGARAGLYKYYLKQLSLEQQKNFLLEITGTEKGLKDFSIQNLADPLAPFIATLKFEFKNAFDKNTGVWRYEDNVLAFDLFFPEMQSILQTKTRENDYISSYKQQIVQESICSAPNNFSKMVVLPENECIENEFLRFNKKFSRENDSIKVKTEFLLEKTHIKQEQFGDFRQALGAVLNKWAWEINFYRRPGNPKLVSLIEQFEKNPDDLNTLINLCRQYIADGSYNEAMELLQKGIGMAPENGEVHYLNGLALGYLERFEESKISLKKAHNLGYRP